MGDAYVTVGIKDESVEGVPQIQTRVLSSVHLWV